MYSVHVWHTSSPFQTGQNERMSWQFQNKLGAWAGVGMIHPISASGLSKSTLTLPHQEFPPIHRLDFKYLLFIPHSFTTIVHLLCAGYHARYSKYISEQETEIPTLMETEFWAVGTGW